jgi:hypothetical protein
MKARRFLLTGILLSAPLIAGCAPDSSEIHAAPAAAATTRPVDHVGESEDDATAWAAIARIMERQGTEHDGVYTVVVPRDDLYVSVEGMLVPTAAGIESRFNFFHCSCGKTSVVGQFVLVDYEVQDVISVLSAADFTIAGIAPFLLNGHPTLMTISFKGEGDTETVAGTLRKAISFTGKERTAPSMKMTPKQ